MAEEQIIIKVEFDADKVTKQIGDLAEETGKLRNDQVELNKAYANGEITLGELTKKTIENKTAIRDNERQMKSLTAQIEVATKDAKVYGDTLNDERARLRDMQNAYAAMSAEMRNSKEGKEFVKQIKEQSDKVKELERSMGDARRNVGNYTEAMKQAGVGVDGLTTKMKAFLANPWALLLAAIVAAFKGIVDAFKRSEDRMRELNRATAPLRGALDMLKQLADGLAKKLSGGLVKVLGKLTEGMGWLARQIDRLGKKVFNKDWGLAEAFAAAGDAVEDLTQKEQAYVDHKRRFVVTEAKLNRDIAELREKVAEKDRYTTEERLVFLAELEEKEKKLAGERRALAAENLAILEADAKRAENDADANDALAEAKAEVIRADAEYLAQQRTIAQQRVSILKEVESANNAASQSEQKNRSEEIRLQKSKLDLWLAEELERIGKANELTQEAYDIQQQYFTDLLALYEQDSVDYNNVLAQKAKYNAEYNAKVRKEAEQTAKKEIEEQKKAKKEAVGSFAAAATSAAAAFDSIADSADKGSKAQKTAAVASVVTAEVGALASQGLAMAEAIEGATSAAAATGPAAPFTLGAFIAEMVALVVSGIVGAISTIKQAKNILATGDAGYYSHGGHIPYVPGIPTTGDNMIAHVDPGEAILTPSQQRTFMDIANGRGIGFDYGALAEVMVAAVAAQPAPVMDYAEFTEFGQKVTTYNEIARI